MVFQSTIISQLGALPQETVAKFPGGINFARAVRGGVAGALAQEVTAEAANAALQAAGLRSDAAKIVSQTVGGGVGGAVTAGGGALARQLGIRLAARAAALAGGEVAAASAMGAELGSFIPGFGTIIGAGIGALVSLGFSIYDTETRKHEPKSPEEEEYLVGLREYMRAGRCLQDRLHTRASDITPTETATRMSRERRTADAVCSKSARPRATD